MKFNEVIVPHRPASNDLSALQQRTETIYQTVRQRICTNRYPPDTILYEEVLAGEFSVSRSPIRRVLSKLEHEGLVEIKHGVGTRVTRIDPDELIQVYEIRMILAKNSGPYFKTPFDPTIFDTMMRLKQDFQGLAPYDLNGFADTNVRYYTELTGLLGNRYMREIQRSLFFQTSRMWLIMLPEMEWEPTIEVVSTEIDDIVRLIGNDDPVGLGLVMRNHLFMPLSRFEDVIRQGKAP